MKKGPWIGKHSGSSKGIFLSSVRGKDAPELLTAGAIDSEVPEGYAAKTSQSISEGKLFIWRLILCLKTDTAAG